MFRRLYYIQRFLIFVSFTVCESDWVSHSASGGCFKYFPLLMSWEDARSYCQENVPYNIGDLVSIPDAATNDFLQTLIQDAYIWTGGFLDANSSWVWSDGTPWDYTNWLEGEPDNGDGVQTHVAFNVDSTGRWDDEFVGSEKSFLCHYKGIKHFDNFEESILITITCHRQS